MVTAQRRLGAYAPLSATYASDDALLEAGEKAELLYCRGLAFCAGRPEAEGFISRAQLAVVGFGLTGIDARTKALVKHGAWIQVDGGYQVRGWLKWNKSASELEREKGQDRARKRAARAPDSEGSPNGVHPDSAPESVVRPADTAPESLSEALHSTSLHSTVPPSAGVTAAPPAMDGGSVIKAWVDSRAANGQPKAAELKRKAVGAEAKRLNAEGYPWEQIVAAATAMGEGPWDDLRKQLGLMTARQYTSSRPPSRGSTTDDRVAAGLAIAARLAAEGL